MRRDVQRQVEQKLREYPELKGSDERLARMWCGVIEAALAELQGLPGRQRMVRLRYFEGRSQAEVQEAVPVGGTSYRLWKQDFLASVAMKAAYKRLIQP